MKGWFDAMYGAVTSMLIDYGRGQVPEPGDECVAVSPARRSFRAYVIQTCSKVRSEMNPSRWRVRWLHVPLSQVDLSTVDFIERYGKGRR